MARLQLNLLGPFEARLEHGGPLVVPTRKTQALLAYLALPAGHAHAREKLAALLWGEMRDAQARSNLRHALARIRTAVPQAAGHGLAFEGPNVSLDPAAVDVDAARFERLVADGGVDALAEAARLYRGDLLLGLSLTERPFEEWLAAERRRLHELAIQGLGRLLTYQQHADAVEPAVQTALRLLALEPRQEPVHRALMQLYARLGRREAALRQYELCVDALKRGLSAAPQPETTRLYEDILKSRPAPPVPPRAVAEPPTSTPLTNLPASISELIGRTAAVAEVRELLAVHRLVTLIGAGGIGKTRLGLEVARQLLPGFADGVWVAELAPLSDPALVAVTVALALGLTLPAGAVLPERVAAALGGKQLLLVLDNCEHVIDAAARMTEALLRANARARVLATSGEPLRAPGEQVYGVPPLEVPPADADSDAELLETPAVKLFMARANAVGFHVASDARTAALMGAVCRRLDGIPLAIELAAARTATLGVEGLAARLDDRFRLLTGGHRTALPRHQTLRATLDWNYELLPSIERTVLHRLAIFAGGFTLEAASVVAADAELGATDVVDRLANLAAKSLVIVEGRGAITRYRLLEMTRAYAFEKLHESSELDEVTRRHAAYYRDLLERAEIDATTRSTVEWLASDGRLLHNVRAALEWAFSPRGDAALGVALTAATVPVWMHLSLMSECYARVERAVARLPQIGAEPRRDMRLFLALGTALLHTRGVGNPDMPAAVTRALELAERLDDTEYRLRAIFELYVYHFITGDYRAALTLAERLASVADRSADPMDGLVGGRLIGVALHILGDQAGARRRIEPLVQADFATGRRAHIVRYQFDQRVVTHSFYARVLWIQGFPDQAVRVAADIVDYARARNHLTSLFYTLVEAACPIALEVGDLEAAEQFVQLIVGLSVRHGVEPWNIWARGLEGVLLIKRGEGAAGARQLRDALVGLPEAAFHFHHTKLLAELADGLGGAGQLPDCLLVIDDALARAERKEERWLLPELLRKKGEFLLLGDARTAADAGDHFARALDWARRQDARFWELRSATSLARLWHRQHQTGPARELLGPIYARFTEGFGTADLRAAKALLDSLS